MVCIFCQIGRYQHLKRHSCSCCKLTDLRIFFHLLLILFIDIPENQYTPAFLLCQLINPDRHKFRHMVNTVIHQAPESSYYLFLSLTEHSKHRITGKMIIKIPPVIRMYCFNRIFFVFNAKLSPFRYIRPQHILLTVYIKVSCQICNNALSEYGHETLRVHFFYLLKPLFFLSSPFMGSHGDYIGRSGIVPSHFSGTDAHHLSHDLTVSKNTARTGCII